MPKTEALSTASSAEAFAEFKRNAAEREKALPPLWLSMLPILVPILLIFVNTVVAGIVELHRMQLDAVWNAAWQHTSAEVAQQLAPLVTEATRDALLRLYPDAASLWDAKVS